jgi:hypothetical protein
MNERAIERIEAGADLSAAAAFALAAAYAVSNILAPHALAAAGGAAAFLGCFGVLRRITPEDSRYELPEFALVELPSDAVGELLLTDADRLAPAARASEELVLDDILAELGPQSRVVRLFDRSSMPTAGQLKDRIDRHLHHEDSPAAPADASQALYEALAELRRSLA